MDIQKIIETIDEPKGWLKLKTSDIRKLNEYCKSIIKENEELHSSNVNKSLPSNDLANWTIRNRWTYNFCDGKWWQLQESQNYIKKTTKEIANTIESNI